MEVDKHVFLDKNYCLSGFNASYMIINNINDLKRIKEGLKRDLRYSKSNYEVITRAIARSVQATRWLILEFINCKGKADV